MSSKAITFKDSEGNNIYPSPYYPVGSVYISVNNINPSNFFGGTWEQIKDKFLLACGDNHKVNETGGEEKHTLITSEMPSHSHGLYEVNPSTGGGSYKMNWDNGGHYNVKLSSCGYDEQGYWNLIGMNNTGGNQAHNNMPPYLTVYMWKRVA